MNIEDLRTFCLSFQQAQEHLPFGEKILVFSVMGKMFCLVDLEYYRWINLKCDPEKAIELREYYTDVTPAYHMNKKHWNSIKPNGNIPDLLVKSWIADSYGLVVRKLPKKIRESIL